MANLSIALNATNDIFVGPDGNLAMVSDIDAVEQDCLTAMKSQLGEMQYNLPLGLPYFDDIWQSQNFVKWEGAARAMLANINGVVSVRSFDITINADNFNYKATIETVYSQTLLTITDTIGM